MCYDCADISPDVEWVSVEHRTLAGIIVSLDVTLANWILVGIAYFVNEWRMLILAVTSPLILSVIAWRYLNFTFLSHFARETIESYEKSV